MKPSIIISAELPERTNFYCSVHTQQGPEALARLFAPPDWRVRKCAWKNYEAKSEFAEVVVESTDPVLIHGPVANAEINCPKIVELLAAAGLSGKFECYDESGSLTFESRFGEA